MTVVDPTVFDGNRNLLFTVAYRILGSAADAEDAVQDAWVRWSSADRSQVADPKAYLVRIVTNLAMDRLRSAKARRETYIGPWLPEPILTTADPTTDAGTADDVSMALLMVLENLSPLERAVFVLKEAFGFSYAEIADAVQRTPDAVRQAGHRARGHVQARRPKFRPTRAQHREVTERFFAAASGGDINTLMQLLAPDVTLWTDGGGKVRQAMRPVVGAEKVATWMAGVSKRPYEGVEPSAWVFEVVELNGSFGIVISGAGRVIGTLSVDLDDHGRIAGILNVANPDKLGAVTAKTVHEI
ncbi:RNA polymerase sigma-70 factor [Virgisporangium aurantiacum]|uniref:RNA polymerase sigma24 factor n=1 Tax=Virgisporangium aurantiacum TaxID=175570 RepID=A0A8J3ZI66_9ACTN|nr:RNA polymerase sigma-70 factor [Virgisporangium aurantiacum]GIJ63382.1 RNA polymerase sigma24 factor [Virgisporangium aurantiacum]